MHVASNAISPVLIFKISPPSERRRLLESPESSGDGAYEPIGKVNAVMRHWSAALPDWRST
jgi:hypothetical protein